MKPPEAILDEIFTREIVPYVQAENERIEASSVKYEA
jgi:hypothetical protein